MKHILILILLIFPSSIDEIDRPDPLEVEIISDNPGYPDWNSNLQEKVKGIYKKYHY